jgi:diguanylate cyclase (GGDEF)-like protein
VSSQTRNPLPRRWQRPLQSLTSRFVATLLGAVVAVSLAVSWISVGVTDSFLRDKIEQKFETTLAATSQRIDLWHAERELELDTLSRSRTLASTLLRLRAAGQDAALAASAPRYLSLVLEQLPQYQALLLLGPDAELLTSVGQAGSLDEALRVRLAGAQEAAVGELLQTPTGRVHAVSAPVRSETGDVLGSVHGLLRNEKFDELLASANLGKEGKIFIVGEGGDVLAPSDVALMRIRYEHSLPTTPDVATVNEYEIEDELAVIGGAVPFAHFGWTLIVEEPYASAFAPVVAITRQTVATNFGIVLLFSTLAFFLARSIVQPVQALSEAAGRIAEGDLEVELPGSARSDEIGVLTRALSEMMSMLWRNQVEVEEKNAELETANESLAQLSVTDGLTGLYNHRYFQLELEREMARADRSGEALALILIDIDDFKGVNDRHGHAAGDRVLEFVAASMRGVTRQSDLLARYGGEEFALLTFRNPLEKAIGLAEKIRMAVGESPFAVDEDGPPERISVSVGVATFKGDERGFFTDADRALYAAKSRGKDCVVSSDEC